MTLITLTLSFFLMNPGSIVESDSSCSVPAGKMFNPCAVLDLTRIDYIPSNVKGGE